jgi:hypothetical protein
MKTPLKPTFAGFLLLVCSLAAPAFASRPEPMIYTGLCDASAVVGLGQGYFAVADDEDNVIRVYRRDGGSRPVYSIELSAFLRTYGKGREVDMEGATRLGDRIYWISSHGRNVEGNECPNRQRFFATTGSIRNGSVDLRPVGQPYLGLLGDLATDPRLARFNLHGAALLPPKAPGALNIEGLASTPDGRLLIGFRNPIPDGKALIVPLLNPAGLIAGQPAEFGDPMQLDLGGLGIRSITLWHDKYVIIAGSFEQGRHPRLFIWDGGADKPRLLGGLELTGLNPEAIAFQDEAGSERLYLVSDDGTVKIGTKDCKKLKNPFLKQFRAVCISL